MHTRIRPGTIGKALPRHHMERGDRPAARRRSLADGWQRLALLQRRLRHAVRDSADQQQIRLQRDVLLTVLGHGVAHTVRFRPDSARLEPGCEAHLKALAQSLALLRDLPLRLTVALRGHTDPRPNPAYELELAQRRVSVVRAVLLHSGLADACIRSDAFGAVASYPGDAQGRLCEHRVDLHVRLSAVPA